MRCLLLLLFFFIICCEFSDENLQGPPDVQDEKKSNDDDEETVTKEFIASIDQDEEGGTAIRIDSAQDFANEKEDIKGLYKKWILFMTT